MDVWFRLQASSFDGIDDDNEQPCHLLWALLFLQVHAVEPVLSGMCECDEDTFRMHAWRFVEKISLLEFDVVSTVLAIGPRVRILLYSVSYYPTLYPLPFTVDTLGESTSR